MNNIAGENSSLIIFKTKSSRNLLIGYADNSFFLDQLR